MGPADHSSRPLHRKSPRVLSSHCARAPFLLLEVSVLQACAGSRGGDVHLTPERGHGRQQRREGLVGGLPVHPEAVDAGVLGVAPVSQDAQLHHLVRGHFRILQRKGRAKNSDWRGDGHTQGQIPPPSGLCGEIRLQKCRLQALEEFPAGGPRSPRGFRGPTGAGNTC